MKDLIASFFRPSGHGHSHGADGSGHGHSHGADGKCSSASPINHGHSHGPGGTCCGAEPDWSTYYWSPWPVALFAYTYAKGRQAYAAYWVPFLFKFGEVTFGGRENAGKVAHQTRIVRALAAATRLAAIYLMIQSMEINRKQFFNEGAELPLWFDREISLDTGCYAWLAMASMAINMMAILFGSAANHHKIQQYYDKQIMLQEISNEKTNEKNTVPHGWHAPKSIFWVNAGRFVHDANGLTGSALSSIIFMSVVVGMAGGSLGLEKSTLGKLFVASSALALLSVMFVPLTTWARLWAHKKEIAVEMNRQVSTTNQKIKTALASVFDTILPSRDKDVLYYHCVRACEHYLAGNDSATIDSSKVSNVIKEFLDNNRVSTEKIKCNASTRRLPLMDALSIIETRVVASLQGTSAKMPNDASQPLPEILLFSKLASRGITDIQPLRDANLIDNQNRIDKAAVARACPTASNPHGSREFVLDYHTEQMVRKCAI